MLHQVSGNHPFSKSSAEAAAGSDWKLFQVAAGSPTALLPLT
jgi:hypothetical protein